MDKEKLKDFLSLNKIDGTSSIPIEDCFFLYTLAKEIKSDGVILEIGSYKGRVTTCLAKGTEEELKSKVYAIDPHLTGGREDFFRNIEAAGIKYLIVPLLTHSAHANRTWNRPIKLIWIETDASFLSMKFDFILWERFLTVGGVFACPRSSRYIDRFMKECILSSDRFKEIKTTDYAIYAYKQKETPAYSAFSLGYIRILYSLHYKIRRIYYNFVKAISPHLTWKNYKVKKIINIIFEKFLKI